MIELPRIQAIFDDNFFVKASYLCQRVCFYAIGYPRYSERELNRNLIDSEEQAREYDLFRKYNLKLYSSQALWILVGVVFVLRELYYIVYTLNTAGLTMSTVDLMINHTKSGLRSIRQHHTITSYGCLETNCPRLKSGPGSLEQDLHEVPLYMICHPHLQSIYTFVHNSSTFGLQTVSLITFVVSIVGVLLPIRLYLRPSSHETAMYLFAPHTILKSNREFIRKNLVIIHDSLISYYQTFVDREYLTSLLMIDMLRKNSLGATQFGSGLRDTKKLIERERDFRSKLIDIHRELSVTKKLRSDYSLLDDHTKAYIDDCLPITRSDSWRLKANRRFWLVVAVVTIYFSAVKTTMCIVLFYTFVIRSEHLYQSDKYMSDTDCAIWMSSDREIIKKQALMRTPLDQWTGAIRLHDYKPVMNTIFIAFSVLPIYVIFTIGIYVPCSQAIVYVEELYLRIAESISRLQLTIDYTLRLTSTGADKTGSTTGSGFDMLLQDYRFDEVREVLQRSVKFNTFGVISMKSFPSIMVRQRLSKLGHSDLYAENFVGDFVEKNVNRFGDNLDAYLSLMTKTLLNIRILHDIIEHSAANLTNILWVCYSLNYGIMIIIIAYNRKYDESGWFSLTVAAIAICITNYIISYASSIQTKSNRILLLMWQVVAITSDFQDIRVKHMRSLFVRQVAVLSQDRGLTMKAFGVNVTYARAIEMTIWTITLIMIAFNIH